MQQTTLSFRRPYCLTFSKSFRTHLLFHTEKKRLELKSLHITFAYFQSVNVSTSDKLKWEKKCTRICRKHFISLVDDMNINYKCILVNVLCFCCCFWFTLQELTDSKSWDLYWTSTVVITHICMQESHVEYTPVKQTGHLNVPPMPSKLCSIRWHWSLAGESNDWLHSLHSWFSPSSVDKKDKTHTHKENHQWGDEQDVNFRGLYFTFFLKIL